MLCLCAELTFEDGTKQTVFTDKTWLSRRENEYVSPKIMDYTLKRDEWINAVEVSDIWNIQMPQIRNLTYETVSSKTYDIDGFSTKENSSKLDKIYSAYVSLRIEAEGEYEIKVFPSEKDKISETVHRIKGIGNQIYRSNEMDSVGEYRISVENKCGTPMRVQTEVIFVYYPSEEKGYFECSDNMLNRIFELSKWTVKICRQSIELDSPVHQENLMCTGDYLVESLVNNYTTGDYSLTRFDLVRMANYFVARNGFKYHTSYSLSWVLMLYDYYMYSGDESIFARVEEGLEKMLKRFKTYENDEGIIEKAPNFMFVDWSHVDGYGLDHPPRALGETVMNALYYEAITLSAKIYEILGEAEKANEYSEKSKKLKEAFNRNFYDPEKRLYFDGRNIPNEVNPLMPENSKKRYYTIYSNTLAVLFDLCGPSESSEIMDKIVGNEEMLIAQPYFLHFVIEAVYKVGLFEKYGLKLIRKWKKLVEECEKGLKEVLYDFKGYEIDYSHGWGATPAYQLPSKIAGIEILEPGFRKIRLNPKLYGLDYANIKIPTPYGTIAFEIKQDNKSISVPDEIEVVKDMA